MYKLVLATGNINIDEPLLTIKELLNTINYEYNDIFLDKFWQNIKDDIWIYIDDNMLKYIGYNCERERDSKKKYLNTLTENFEVNLDFKILNSGEFKNVYSNVSVAIENKEFNEHNKVKHLIVSPDCFKQSLMLLKTTKSKEIKKYYIELERVFKFYLEYQNEYRKLELNNKNQELEEKENIINKQKKELNDFINIQTKTINKLKKYEYVYITTNKLNAKNNVFKIGKCNHLTGRLSSFNVNSLLDNEFYYTNIHPCYNSRILENLLHSLLSPFNYKNELFQLHYKPFSNLFNQICMHYDLITNLINEYIENHYINDIKLENIIPNKINHKELNINDDTNVYNSNNDNDNNNLESSISENDIATISMDENYYLYKNTKLYICPRNCSFACKERNTMLNHLSRVYLCKKIETDKYLKENLNDDIIKELINQNNIKYFVCSDCNKYFISASKLNRHRIAQEGCETIYNCQKCNREFRNSGMYNTHIGNIYCLDDNGNRMNTNDGLSTNEESDTNEESNNYIIINHNGTKLYKCKLCKKICNSFGNLKSHLNKKNKCNLIHKCQKCTREFHTLENLNKHLKQKIKCENQLFECSKCKKHFTTNKNLLKHIKNINCI
jgi:hypothetical protein